MADEIAANAQAANSGVGLGIVQLEPARHLAQCDREERWREVAADPRAQRHGDRRRPPDVDFQVWPKDRLEEAKALEVVHVQVRDQHVDATHLGGNLEAKGSNPRPGIEHEMLTLVADDKQRGGVASITNRAGTRRGERSSRSPDLNPHALAPPDTGQKIAAAPSTLPPCPTRGIAVASTGTRSPLGRSYSSEP